MELIWWLRTIAHPLLPEKKSWLRTRLRTAFSISTICQLRVALCLKKDIKASDQAFLRYKYQVFSLFIVDTQSIMRSVHVFLLQKKTTFLQVTHDLEYLTSQASC
jgi:hypothetical protein